MRSITRKTAISAALRARYAEGIGWGEMKQCLFEYVDAHLADARAEYERQLAGYKL